jgi:hypothetical protein
MTLREELKRDGSKDPNITAALLYLAYKSHPEVLKIDDDVKLELVRLSNLPDDEFQALVTAEIIKKNSKITIH